MYIHSLMLGWSVVLHAGDWQKATLPGTPERNWRANAQHSDHIGKSVTTDPHMQGIFPK